MSCPTGVRKNAGMAAIQTPDEIRGLLARLQNQTISTLQVLGINSLKSMSPMPDALVGAAVESTTVDDRRFTITTQHHRVVIDLQRTGKLVWLTSAAPYAMSAGSTRPTVRLILANGAGLDLTEPSKTKRITVTIATRS